MNGTSVLTPRPPVSTERAKDQTNAAPHAAKIATRDLSFFYGRVQALHGITLEIPDRQVTAFIGPSGCGKSTFLRTLNRMNDLIDDVRITGSVRVKGLDLY